MKSGHPTLSGTGSYRFTDSFRNWTRPSVPNSSQEFFQNFLPIEGHERLRTRLGSHSYGALQAAASQSDVRMMAESLFRVGQTLQFQGDRAGALMVYQGLLEHLPARLAPLRKKIHQEAAGLTGEGAPGRYFENLGQGWLQEATRPSFLIGMVWAQWAFGMGRGLILNRFFPKLPASFLTRGKSAQLLATLGGMGLEAPAFVLGTQGVEELMGQRQNWNLGHMVTSSGHTLLALGMLRLFGWTGKGAVQRMLLQAGPVSRAELSPWVRASTVLIPQAAMFGGIYTGNRMEMALGFRPQQGHANSLMESGAMFFQFQFAGTFLRHLGMAKPEKNTDSRSVKQNDPKASGWFGPRQPVAPNGLVLSQPAVPESFRPKALAMQSLEHAGGKRFNGGFLPPYDHVFPFRKHNGLVTVHADLFKSIALLPETVRLINIHTDLGAFFEPQPLNDKVLTSLRQEFSRMLYDHPNVNEIRVLLGNRNMLWFGRDHLGRIHHQHFSPFETERVKQEAVYSLEATRDFTLLFPHRQILPDISLARLLKKARLGSGISLRAVATKIRKRLNNKFTHDTLRIYEKEEGRVMPFPVLQALGEIYQVRLPLLIELSNRAAFPKLSPHLWRTAQYPIYLEGKHDLERLNFYQNRDPDRKTLGWWVYRHRKNPQHYRLPKDFEAHGVEGRNFTYLELNQHPPTFKTLQGLAQGLELSVSTLIDVANRTYYGDLPLEKLFPGMSIPIDPHSNDLAKIKKYQKKPGSFGQLLFTLRKSHPDNPGIAEMTQGTQRGAGFWNRGEYNRIAFKRSQLGDWLELLQKQGIHLEPFEAWLEKYHLRPDSPAYLMAKAIGIETAESLSNRTGVGEKNIQQLLVSHDKKPPRALEPHNILRLQMALPQLPGDLLYQQLHPSIGEIFPRAMGRDPYLNITSDQIDAAARLHLGQKLFAYRMNHQVSLHEASQRLEVSDNSVYEYETVHKRIESVEVIQNFSDLLGIDPKIIYLNTRPELLGLFKVPAQGEGILRRLEPDEYESWLTLQQKTRDPNNMRSQLWEAMAARGLNHAADLKNYLGLEKLAQANKFYWTNKPLTVTEIELLRESFPELSYRQWYEHFYSPVLNYFLGRGFDGQIDYQPPRGFLEGRWDATQMKKYIYRAIEKGYESREAAAEQLGLSLVKHHDNLRRILQSKKVKNQTLATLANGLGLDRRLLFFYFREGELRPILEEMGMIADREKGEKKTAPDRGGL